MEQKIEKFPEITTVSEFYLQAFQFSLVTNYITVTLISHKPFSLNEHEFEQAPGVEQTPNRGA